MSSLKFILGLCTLAVINGVVALGPAPVNLGTAANYAVLAKSGISTVPNSAITGDIGLSPAAASALTGFSLTLDSTGTFSRSLQIVGKAFAASYASPTPTLLTAAVLNMQTAFNDANSRVNPTSLNLGAGTLTSQTLAPGLYKWTTGVLIPTDLTFQGSATDTWILQIAGTLTLATSKKVILLGGALPKNIVWAVSGSVTSGAGAHIEGIVLSATSITLGTGASINGRLLSQTAVNLQKAVVTQP